MERNIPETPERWVLLKLPDNNYKVFGTWIGGYLNGDKWKLNSGIERIEQDDDYYYFIGFSGSCYRCHKKGYGVASSYGQNILNRIMELGKGKIQLIENLEDFICPICNQNLLINGVCHKCTKDLCSPINFDN